MGLCSNSLEVGGEISGHEKARIEMIQVLQKQPPSLAEKVQKMPRKMLVLAKAQRRSQGAGGAGHSGRGSRGEPGNLFALDFVLVFLLQRPRKTQWGVN